MHKHSKKKQLAGGRRSRNFIKRWVWFMLTVIIFASLTISYYHQRQPFSSTVVYDGFQRATVLFAKGKDCLQNKLKSMKETKKNSVLALAEQSKNKEIHFEFYQTLPNMQIAKPMASGAIIAPDMSKPATTKPLAHTMVANADDIEKEFAKELKQAHKLH